MQNIYKHNAGSIDAQPTSVSSDTTSIVPALRFMKLLLILILFSSCYVSRNSTYQMKVVSIRQVGHAQFKVVGQYGSKYYSANVTNVDTLIVGKNIQLTVARDIKDYK